MMGSYRRLLLAALLGVAVLVSSTPSFASGNAYSTLQADWLWEVQDLLYQAAAKGTRWEADREEIEHHIRGIGFALQQAVMAEYWSDRPRAKFYLTEALDLVREGIRRGYFRSGDVQPVMTLVDLYRDIIKV